MHRDPETGQFVAGSTMHSDVERFRDYEFLHVHNRYDVDAADLPGAFAIQEEDIVSVDFSDILDRDERADLVALQIHSLQASVPGTSSAESALNARWELGIGAGSLMVTSGDVDSSSNDAGSSGVVDINEWAADSPDVLYFASWVSEGGYADSTNGLGGGPDQPVISDQVHYPREFGACPIFDERDEISESFLLTDQGGADISDSLIILDASYSLVFGVSEEQTRR